ncbi:hypothetical protein E5163_10950 [Marinicauda algicola]|uniref:RHS repeat-associated core domain-containing protein n=1 Tax=Marinicauda algicola TaxID=2029849 RepID=A0A4S2H061_9PROT|nr:hypothetical protein E5163_10950 [Marinicauda algicola]
MPARAWARPASSMTGRRSSRAIRARARCASASCTGPAWTNRWSAMTARARATGPFYTPTSAARSSPTPTARATASPRSPTTNTAIPAAPIRACSSTPARSPSTTPASITTRTAPTIRASAFAGRSIPRIDRRSGSLMQTDPIGVAGGINLYAYVGGDPVNFTDPWGLKTRTG